MVIRQLSVNNKCATIETVARGTIPMPMAIAITNDRPALKRKGDLNWL